MHETLRARLKATWLHATISGVIALAVGMVVFGIWYPMPYRDMNGGKELFMLIVGVDIVMGPLLTFVVFDKRKGWPHLRKDLAIIALLQIVALGYGVHTMTGARPVYIAFEVDRFRVVTASDIDSRLLGEAPQGLNELPWTGFKLINTVKPKDAAALMRSVDMSLQGLDLGMQPFTWAPYDAMARNAAVNRASSVEELKRRYQGMPQQEQLEVAVRATGRAAADLLYLPLVARQASWTMFLDSNGEPVGYAPVDSF